MEDFRDELPQIGDALGRAIRNFKRGVVENENSSSPTASSWYDVKYTLWNGVPSTCNAARLRSTRGWKLPTSIRDGTSFWQMRK